MNELTTMRWSFEEDVEEFAQSGFEGIGIWRQKLSDVGEKNGIKLLRQKGLRCSNLLWAGGFTGSDGRPFRDSVDDAIDAIRTAAAVDADCLVLYSGAWGGHVRSHAYRLVQNALKEILPCAEEFGVCLAVEPTHPGCGNEWTFLNTVDEALEMIDSYETPFLKIALDTYHFGLQTHDLNRLSQIANRVGIVHLGDGVQIPSGEQDRCLLGQGIVPIRQIVETLIEAGYDGFLDVELIGESVEQYDYPTLIRESRDYMTEMFASK